MKSNKKQIKCSRDGGTTVHTPVVPEPCGIQAAELLEGLATVLGEVRSTALTAEPGARETPRGELARESQMASGHCLKALNQGSQAYMNVKEE